MKAEDAMGCMMLIFAAIVVFIMCACIAVGGYAFHWYALPFQGAMQAREQIQGSGTFRIQAYTKFYNDCASIQALEKEVDSQINLLTTLAPGSNNAAIVNQNIAGVGGARDAAIQRYNTESHQQWTIAQFKSEHLAFELPSAAYLTLTPDGKWQKGTPTVCVIS